MCKTNDCLYYFWCGESNHMMNWMKAKFISLLNKQLTEDFRFDKICFTVGSNWVIVNDGEALFMFMHEFGTNQQDYLITEWRSEWTKCERSRRALFICSGGHHHHHHSEALNVNPLLKRSVFEYFMRIYSIFRSLHSSCLTSYLWIYYREEIWRDNAYGSMAFRIVRALTDGSPR